MTNKYDKAADAARMPDGSISASRFLANCDAIDAKAPTLTEYVGTLTTHARNFTTHWMDDDDPEDHAAALAAGEKVDQAESALCDALLAARATLAALDALTTWGREHTSPRDPNSPHALLVAAVAAIAQAKAAGITTP